MIAEVAANHKIAEMFRQLAQVLTGRSEAKRSKVGMLGAAAAEIPQAIGLGDGVLSRVRKA